MYDVLGKEIILRENLTDANGKLNYDLNLSKGVYFIELIANEGRLVKKLVVH
ncbi:MAG: T9SS type A sorting domain-containing protein [Bacteroidetes bacterium]|nr:T9SS type A sorting domain-containing protein [Bacteroidota bacterium]